MSARSGKVKPWGFREETNELHTHTHTPEHLVQICLCYGPVRLVFAQNDICMLKNQFLSIFFKKLKRKPIFPFYVNNKGLLILGLSFFTIRVTGPNKCRRNLFLHKTNMTYLVNSVCNCKYSPVVWQFCN